MTINNWQKDRISKHIVNSLFGTVSNKKLAILGFAFKANTNDTRESPAINICKKLIEEGAFLKIYDPKVKEHQIIKEEVVNKIFLKVLLKYKILIIKDFPEET